MSKSPLRAVIYRLMHSLLKHHNPHLSTQHFTPLRTCRLMMLSSSRNVLTSSTTTRAGASHHKNWQTQSRHSAFKPRRERSYKSSTPILTTNNCSSQLSYKSSGSALTTTARNHSNNCLTYSTRMARALSGLRSLRLCVRVWGRGSRRPKSSRWLTMRIRIGMAWLAIRSLWMS